jgi:hypothetical protein
MSTELYKRLTKEQQQYRFEQAKIHTDYIVKESQKQG